MTNYAANPNSVESFGEMVRAGMHSLIEDAMRESGADVWVDGTIELVTWKGVEYGFRASLSNGASFDIVIRQHDLSEEADEFAATESGEIIECGNCGNTPSMSGFVPCDQNGVEVEPTDVWNGHYRCMSCGRVAVAVA